MTSFDKWASDLADSINGKSTSKSREKVDTPEYGMIDEDLWEYNKAMDSEAPWIYPCRGCDQDKEVEYPEDFDPDMHYCGGSPRCCP